VLPSNDAFINLDEDFFNEIILPENNEDLRNLLLYHILPGATQTTEFTEGPADTLFTGNQVNVGLDPIVFDDASVTTADIIACNGYIDVIDQVLNPFEAREYFYCLLVLGASNETNTSHVSTLCLSFAAATPAPVVLIDTLSPTSAPVTAAPVVVTATPVATDAPVIATVAPSAIPSASPITPGPQIVRIQSFYLAYLTGSAVEPTQDEYNRVLNETTAYFNGFFETFYANRDDVTFLGVESMIDSTAFGQGRPFDESDVYIDFSSTEVVFAEDSALPSSDEIFQIMSDSITTEYILQIRDNVGGTFADTTAVSFGASAGIIVP